MNAKQALKLIVEACAEDGHDIRQLSGEAIAACVIELMLEENHNIRLNSITAIIKKEMWIDREL